MADGWNAHRRAVQVRVSARCGPRASWLVVGLVIGCPLGACGRVGFETRRVADASWDAQADGDADDGGDDGAAEPDAERDASDADDGGDDGAEDADGTVDAGPPPDVPMLLAPTNGATTGSVWTGVDEPVADHPLRPWFRWLPVDDAASYEFELTSECETPGFAACGFVSAARATGLLVPSYRPSVGLDVSLIVPMGRRYYWRARACSSTGACSAWSGVRYLDVGRGADDFNGDGYADVIVGAWRQDNPEASEGSAYVYFGSASGPGDVPDVVLDNPLDQAAGQFGWSVASAGDVNGDGYADVIVGAYYQANPESTEGSAYVYFGSASGPGYTPDVTLDNPADQAFGDFGTSVASAGDVNGDGYVDVIVGASMQDNPDADEGSAYVYFGSASGPGDTPDVTLDNPVDPVGGAFGASVASAGDVNGDGYADVVVGAFLQDSPAEAAGSAYVYFGSSTGLPEAPDVMLDNPLNQVWGYFGISVARVLRMPPRLLRLLRRGSRVGSVARAQILRSASVPEVCPVI